jgi:hypothetical protein
VECARHDSSLSGRGCLLPHANCPFVADDGQGGVLTAETSPGRAYASACVPRARTSAGRGDEI